MDLSGLKLLLARQNSNTAALAGTVLLKTLHDQLEGLVGVNLARRLIGAPPGFQLAAERLSSSVVGSRGAPAGPVA